MGFLLDIIVPHYKEPWEKVKPFFSMLNMQRGVDFSLLRVTMVHDGEDCIFPEENFADCPYEVRQINIPHAGVSSARNEGLHAATADWVMFCDCDDMLAHPFAMMDILNVLPTDKADVLWTEICIEDKRNYEAPVFIKHGFNTVFVHGKLFRRQFLIDNNIEFDETISYCEDSLFVTTALITADESRIAKIRTQLPDYIWCDTDGSVTNTYRTKDIAPGSILLRNKKICELYKEKRSYADYCTMVARTVFDAYYYLNRPELSSTLIKVRNDFYIWFKNHETEWSNVPYETLKVLKEKSRKSVFTGVEQVNEDLSVTKWLKSLDEANDKELEEI